MSDYIFTPQNDFTGTGVTYDKTYPNFGLTVYKNKDYHQGNLRLSQHIAPLVEVGVGAHYYAQGRQIWDYTKAQVTVDLTKIELDTKGRRTACISLNVIGDKGGCDVGIENTGKGWFAHYWCKKLDEGKSGPVVNNAQKCTITIRPYRDGNKDIVEGTFLWTLSNGDTKEEKLICTGTQDSLFLVAQNGVPSVRFTRFMSLIPNDGIEYSPDNDYNDESYMKGGNFKDVKLFTTSGGSIAWTNEYFDFIWSVQGWNITACSVGGATDSFSIDHLHNVYKD